MPSLIELDLAGSRSKVSRLPVSRFPDWAAIYFCDNCGANVTKFVRWVSGHSARPIGAETRTCICRRVFKTGCTEWDRLSPIEQERHKNGFLTWLIVPTLFALLGIPVAFLTFVLARNWRIGLFASAMAGLLWLIYADVRLRAAVIASRRRTRGDQGLLS